MRRWVSTGVYWWPVPADHAAWPARQGSGARRARPCTRRPPPGHSSGHQAAAFQDVLDRRHDRVCPPQEDKELLAARVMGKVQVWRQAAGLAVALVVVPGTDSGYNGDTVACGQLPSVAGRQRDSRRGDESGGCFPSECQRVMVTVPSGDREVRRDHARPGRACPRAGRD
jgi:hypothetical protein